MPAGDTALAAHAILPVSQPAILGQPNTPVELAYQRLLFSTGVRDPIAALVGGGWRGSGIQHARQVLFCLSRQRSCHRRARPSVPLEVSPIAGTMDVRGGWD